MNKLIFLLAVIAIGWMGWEGQQQRMEKAAAKEQAEALAAAASAKAAVGSKAREPISVGGIPASTRGRDVAGLDLNALPPTAAGGAWHCDGRKSCSQMTSCAEARFFAARCPGVKMDLNGDGLPCTDRICSPTGATLPSAVQARP